MCPGPSNNRCTTPIPAPLVLILEHDGGTRSAMCLLLHSAGYQVLLAAVLVEAMTIARQRCGLELLVMSSPVSCGTPATQAIGALRQIAGRQLRVILLLDSLWCVPGELRRDPRIRLARKPVKPDELLSALSALRVR